MKSIHGKFAAMPNTSTVKSSGNARMRIECSQAKETTIHLESKAQQAGLESYIASVQERFNIRFPGIAYDAPRFDFRLPSGQTDSKGQPLCWQQVFQTKILFSRPNLVEAALTSLHPSFGRAARAILANRALENKSKDTSSIEKGLRLLAYLAHSSSGEELPARQSLQFECLTLHDLTVDHLRHIERCVLTACLTAETAQALNLEKLRFDHLIVPGVAMRGANAHQNRVCINELRKAIAVLLKAKVIRPINARLDQEVEDLLVIIEKHQVLEFRKGKAVELEPSIGALSDAIAALADGDARLSKIQQAVLCVMGLEMCAPSRINEVLALSIHDRLRAVAAYDEVPKASEVDGHESMTITESKLLHRGHSGIKEASYFNSLDIQPNTILMKGSKGAAWGAKPVLEFMLVMFNWCVDRLIQLGSRSRLLLEHYEKHPTLLYLPPELEHLRGKTLSVIQIGRIMLLDGELGADLMTFKAKAQAAKSSTKLVRRALDSSGLMFTLDSRPDLVDQIFDERAAFIATQDKKTSDPTNSRQKGATQKARRFPSTSARTEYAEWSSVETELLKRVNRSMYAIRWVSEATQYKGRLSNMLMLFDHLEKTPPYLPNALSAQDVSKRLKAVDRGARGRSQTVFEALDLTMPILSEDGTKLEIVQAYCRSHDPRRWLTTMALRHSGPELSRLLINLWANRADVGQLNAYDYRSPEEKSALTAQDVPQGMCKAFLPEHDDLSRVLKDELVGEYKLQTQSISVGLHAIRVTTMDAIHAAESNHPVARAGGKLIIVFPTPYGVCLHQHHEVGCTNYRGCGGACSDQRVIKGHLPTNALVRRQANRTHDVIVAQVRRLILARNRRVVHDLDRLDEHLSRMIQQHMDVEDIASRLISDFLEVKDLIKDSTFRADLEDAYAFKGKVERLNSPEVHPGAVIRYYNPERNGRPEAERTIEALGGRETIENEAKAFLVGRDYMRLDAEAVSDVEGEFDDDGEGLDGYDNDSIDT